MRLRHEHADRVKRTVSKEHGKRGQPRDESERREPSGHPHTILLGDAHLEEPARMGRGKLIRLG